MYSEQLVSWIQQSVTPIAIKHQLQKIRYDSTV